MNTNFFKTFLVLAFICFYNISFSNDSSIAINEHNEDLVSFSGHLPNGFSTIVIDPGHGGNDEGCKVNNIVEKQISLAIAKELGRKLQDSYPSLQIIYTREHDQYVSLQDRIATANQNQADLFISIHCNYVNEKYVSGSETYVLGDDSSSAQLVEKEESGYVAQEFINSIQFKKLENHAYIKSLDLASKIEDSFAGLRGMKSRGVRHGSFRVLQMTSMPSVLIEAGFLSNTRDLNRLKSKKGQKAIAQSIYDACINYFSELNTIEQESTPETVVKYDPPTIQPIYSLTPHNIAPGSKKTYQIQIAEFQNAPIISTDTKWSQLKEVEIVQHEDRYIYLYGTFNDLASAVEKQEELDAQGFKGAFVIVKSEE